MWYIYYYYLCKDVIEISIPLYKEKEEQCYLYYGDKHYEEKGYVPLGIEGIVRIETSYPVKQKMSELSTHFEGKPDYTMVCKAKYNISDSVGGEIWKVYDKNSIYLLKKARTMITILLSMYTRVWVCLTSV